MELVNQDRMRGASSAVLPAAAAWLGVYLAARIGLEYMRAGSLEAKLISFTPMFAYAVCLVVARRRYR